MNIQNLSVSSVLLLHSSVRQALETDDNLPEEQSKIHEVREESDWKIWSDQLEAELDKKNAIYQKIKW